MCGIVGYIGSRDALPVIMDGLKRLEYRGYDSAGIAYLNGNGLEIYKTMGRISDLEAILPCKHARANLGIGHTRWATHGAPSQRNAHPHSADGIVVVHNGIIENYMELKSRLVSEGHRFASETDTEIIPQLISNYFSRGMDLESAVKAAIRELKGTFALGILSEREPGVLLAARNGSPLVLGIGEGEYFFASDIPAILAHTRKFIFLEDGHVCAMSREGIRIESLDGTPKEMRVEDDVVEVDWTASMAEKEGYDHFMLKEIHEQPMAIRDTLGEWLNEPGRFLEALGLEHKNALSIGRLQIVACGTSYHAALVGKYMIEGLAHVPVDVDIASEYRYKENMIEKSTLFISITQSGETADTLAAQREAKRKGAMALTICNAAGSTASREADHVLYTRAGPEIGVASTKTFTAQIAALSMLALVLGTKRGRLTRAEAETIRKQLEKMPSLVEKTLLLEGDIREIAKKLLGWKDFLYLGRGINYPIALEGALKLKEISYIHAEGYPAGEMKHGPIALIEEGLPVVFLAPMDALFEKTFSNIEEVKARGGKIIAVVDDKVRGLEGKVGDFIKVPSTHPSLSPFVNVVPLQLLAYHIAVMKKCDVDKPRNLAKSVTVE